MMNYLKLFGLATLAIGTILYLASADEHRVVMGDQVSDLSDYTKISVNTSTDLKVRVGEAYGLHVKADEKDLKFLKIYIKGQTLVIEHKKKFFKRWRGDRPKIDITLPRLIKFTLNGSSDAHIEGIHGYYFQVAVNGSGRVDFSGATRELQLEVNGSGDVVSPSFDFQEGEIEISGSGTVDMSGECGYLELELHGSGDFAGQDFKCDEIEVEIIGSGDAKVFVRGLVEVDVMGSGKVDVYGNPKKIRDRSHKKNHVTVH